MNREGNKEKKKLNNVMTAGIMIAVFLLLWSLARNTFSFYHRVSPWSTFEAKVLGPEHVPDGVFVNSHTDPNAAFRNSTSVEARVLRTFSGKYMREPQDGYRYHVMELLVVDLIAGDPIPRIVYCMFSSETPLTGIKPFQSFIIALGSPGLGRYAMINADKKVVETFGNMFTADASCVIPVKNGKVDGEFRETARWGIYCCDCDDPDDRYLVHAGQRIGEIKQRIRMLAATAAEEGKIGYKTVLPSEIHGWRAKLLYRYVSNSTVGVFYQLRDGGGDYGSSVTFIRWVNNKYFGERVEFYISDGKIVDAEYKGKYAKWFPFLQTE